MPFKRAYTDEQFLQAVKQASYMTEALRILGVADSSSKTFKKALTQLKPDVSHWIDINVLKMNNFKTGAVEIPLKEVLVENSSYVYSDLKKKLLKFGVLEEKCYECPLKNEWNGKSLVLQLDHINGVHNDNRAENLRLLCPNCHSQTETFCGKLAKTKLPKCKYCDNFVRDKRAKTCKQCYLNKDYRTLTWPKDEELVKLLNLYTFREVSKSLKINESSIRRRIYKKELNVLIARCK